MVNGRQEESFFHSSFLIPHSSLIVKGWRWWLSAKLNVLTGATGLLGNHIAEQLVERGERVRALVRPTSDTTFLRTLGVELIEGDLSRPETLPPALAGASVVYHCAARVGDWVPWQACKTEIA